MVYRYMHTVYFDIFKTSFFYRKDSSACPISSKYIISRREYIFISIALSNDVIASNKRIFFQHMQ